MSQINKTDLVCRREDLCPFSLLIFILAEFRQNDIIHIRFALENKR